MTKPFLALCAVAIVVHEYGANGTAAAILAFVGALAFALAVDGLGALTRKLRGETPRRRPTS